MSVSREEYVILGQLYEYTSELSDKVDHINQYNKDKVGDFMALVDGMNGDYIIIGMLLAVGDEYDGLSKVISFTSDELDEFKTEIVPEIAKLEIIGWSSIPFKIHILTHWH
jgi:hypothetical protein